MATTLPEIFAARRRIAPYVRRTPLVPSDWLSASSGASVSLKLESQQVTHAFKIRGAFNASLMLREQGRRPTLVTASTGSHGRGLSYAARLLGFDCTVFAPSTSARTKLEAIRANGAELITDSSDYYEAELAAKALAASRPDAVFVSPYNDPRIIAATGTIGLELIEDQPSLDTVIVPIGGGGLISGIAIAIKAIRPSARVIGVEAAANPVFHTMRREGRLTVIDPQPTIADALGGNNDPESLTNDVIARLVDEIVLVSEAEIADAMRHLAVHDRLIVEGAGAVTAAAIATGRVSITGRQAAAIVSGANVDGNRLLSILSHDARSAARPA